MWRSRERRWRRVESRGWASVANVVSLTLGWLAAAAGGQLLSGDREMPIGHVATDTRNLPPGSFFVALRGPRFDGNAFVGEAIERGAAGAMVDRGFEERADVLTRIAVVQVPDTTTGLQALAHAVRTASGTRVIAITGSAGKTTTKETIAAFLANRFDVVKNKGNLNNHIGLPISLLQLRTGPDVAVMELGMNHAGEISTLVAIAEPDVRVWTNVGDAHLGFFESSDAIAEAKAEILERADRRTVLVCNADDRRIMSRVTAFPGKIVTFGSAQNAVVRAASIEDRGVDGMRARLSTPAGEATLDTPLLGRGNLSNVLAATAVALEFGVPLADIVTAAARLQPADHRGAVHRLTAGITLVDDSYNSSPTALQRALEVVARETRATRKVAVLGEMLELGHAATQKHDECGRAAAQVGLALLFAVGGEAAQTLAKAAVSAGMPPSAVTYVERSERASELVKDAVRPGDLVLVKGSRGIRTDIVVDRLLAEFA
jgi:UDP-N-acetylmuramoyl-tripeptide--D-alanyl-D-alanine ligase